MNNSRRKRIADCINKLEDAQEKLKKVLDDELKALASLPDDEEFDDMRNSMNDITSGLEDTLSSLDDALDTINGADF